VNDETKLRQSGGKRDLYEVFRRMLESGDPPNDWPALVKRAKVPPDKAAGPAQAVSWGDSADQYLSFGDFPEWTPVIGWASKAVLSNRRSA
jgi:hypothetical protein